MRQQTPIYDYLYEDETTVEPATAEAATIEQFSESNSESDSESEIKNSPPVSMGRAAVIATSKKVENECHYDIFGNKVCAQKTVTTGHCPLHEEFRLGSLPEPTCDMRYPFSNQKRMECFCKFGYLRDNTKGNDGPCTVRLKMFVRRRNLVIFEVLKNRGRKFHSQNLKNDQISAVGPTFMNALYFAKRLSAAVYKGQATSLQSAEKQCSEFYVSF